MRVKDICGNNRNVKLEQIEVNFVGDYPRYWYKDLRIVLNDDQIKQYNALNIQTQPKNDEHFTISI